MYDVNKIRQDFPILSRKVYDRPLIYLDNAATTQKPRQVIQALVDYYERYNANVHRGVHALSQEATERYEEARAKVARFIGAESSMRSSGRATPLSPSTSSPTRGPIRTYAKATRS